MALFLQMMEDNVAIMHHLDPEGRWGNHHEWTAPGGFQLQIATVSDRPLYFREAYEMSLRLGLWVRTADVITFDFELLAGDRRRIGHGWVVNTQPRRGQVYPQ